MEDLSKELKVLLYKRINSPFWVFYVISLIICNYKFILFLVSSDYKVLEKINIIEGLVPNSYSFLPTVYSMLIIPISISLSYIIVFPFIERKILMPIWKKHKMKLKEDYAKLDKQEIMTGEEKSKYLDEILNLKKEKDKLVEDLTNIDLANESKINKVKEEIAEKNRKEKEKLNTDFDIKLKENEKILKESYENKIKIVDKKLQECIKEMEIKNKLIENLENKHTKDLEYISSIKEKEYSEKIDLYLETIKKFEEKEKRGNKLIEELEIKVKGFLEYSKELETKNKQLISEIENYEKIKNEFENERYKKYLEKYTAEELNIFKIIYEFDIKDRIHQDIFVDEMIKKSNIKRIACEHVIEQLIKKDLIRKDSLNNIIYQASLKQLIYEIFVSTDKIKEKEIEFIYEID